MEPQRVADLNEEEDCGAIVKAICHQRFDHLDEKIDDLNVSVNNHLRHDIADNKASIARVDQKVESLLERLTIKRLSAFSAFAGIIIAVIGLIVQVVGV